MAISLAHASKVYRVALKRPGLTGAIRGLFRRSYRDVQAVKDISFSIEAGEIVGFLGPNGAGKTTTLKMLSGLLYPSGGELCVLGHVPHRREREFLTQVTLVMGQKQQLSWDLAPMDSFLVNKAIYDIPEHVFSKRLDRLVDMLALTPVLDKPVRQLSLGERMKCELTLALLHEPRVLFLDEPTIGLDLNAQLAVRGFIADYNRLTGATIILTSHYMADVEALARRVIVIDHGQLRFDGSLAVLVEKHGPQKKLRIVLGEEVPTWVAQLAEYVGQDGREVTFAAERQRITALAARLLAELPVIDISIDDPPMEEVMGKLFAGAS